MSQPWAIYIVFDVPLRWVPNESLYNAIDGNRSLTEMLPRHALKSCVVIYACLLSESLTE